jgi:4-amino-4-deoxy-L-arabinose transferase-like glycosyltransferase
VTNGQGSPRMGTRRLRLDVLIGVVLLVACVVVRLPTLAQPLLEAHGFRQTQTAFTAVLFHLNGIDLLHAKLPVLGPPFEVPFEFPLFQVLASLVMDVGVAPDSALRATAFGAFLVAAVFLWAIIARAGGRVAGLIALGCFLFSPFAMLWSRAALIEYLAAAAALGFMWFALEWRGSKRRTAFAAALLLGIVAMLVKATIGIWLLPFLVLDPDWRTLDIRAGRWKPTAAAWSLVALPGVVGLAWTHYADSIKASTPATEWLTSSALTTWNFGTLAQRGQLSEWGRIGGVIGTSIGGFGPLVLLAFALPLAVLFAWRRAGALPVVAWLIMALVGGPLIFFNLYWVHDYYSSEISPAVAGIIGLAVGGLLTIRAPAVLRAAGGLTVVALWLAALLGQASYWSIAYEPVHDPERVLPAARQIAAETSTGQLVAILDRDWSPAILYYAGRWGRMVRAPDVRADTLDSLAAQGFAVYSCATDLVDPPCLRLR